MPRPPDPRYRVFLRKLERRRREILELKRWIGCLLIIANECLMRLPRDASYYYITRTKSRKRVGDRTYEYEYIEVYEYARSGTNARLACRVRADTLVAKMVEDAAKMDTALNQLYGCLLQVRFLCEQLLELYIDSSR
ncbi:MAG: hypothetical protein DRJ67_01020 [Thermoprotei archaeon]|nr:MAG: hypothetical protein DRJ67_01020 [Thermoprotei archaeon]